MAEPLFRIHNVTKVYDKHVVLNGINLDIQPGEILGIIGASGSGKTTLLNTLIGFIQPDKGDVLFRLHHLLDFKEKASFRSVYKNLDAVKNLYGFASQVPSFYRKLSVKENLEYFGKLYNLSKEAIRNNTETLLTLMDLKKSEYIGAEHLSGGMERRLDIACSLMHDPDILILDEPTADLDPVLRVHIWDLVKKINKKGTTIVLSSHNLHELETFANRVAILKDGKIIEVGSPSQITSKYSRGKEIRLETYPGNYDKIMHGLRKGVKGYQKKGTQLVIKVTNPELVLDSLLSRLDSLHENILDLKISRPTLEEVFIGIYAEDEE